MRHDPKRVILADLMHRVDGLAGQRGHMSVSRLHDEVDQIRHVARAFRLDTVEGLAGTLESALSLHGMGPVVLSYLDLMRDAIVAGMSGDGGTHVSIGSLVAHQAATPLAVLRG